MRVNSVVSFQQYTSNTLTSAVATSTAATKNDAKGLKANAVMISVGGSSGTIRFRDDGTAPTSNIGMRLPAATVPYLYTGDIYSLQFIADSVPGNADLNLTWVKVVDE